MAAQCDPNGDPGLYQFCVNLCAAGRNVCYTGCEVERDFCQGACNLAKAGCDLENIACFFERDLLDNLLDGHTIGMSYAESRIIQAADVCVTGTCEAVHPHESTEVNLENFHVAYFPEDDPLGFGQWLNGKVTDMVNDMVAPSETIKSCLLDAEGEGLLVGAFSNEIKNDGCSPVQRVKDCQGAACSMATASDNLTNKSASILLYSLPMLMMAGLILLRRRQK